MISRRSFLAALSLVPFVGKPLSAALAAGDDVGRSVPTPREVRKVFYVDGHEQYKDSVFPFRYPEPGCACAACRVHHAYIHGGDIRSVEGWRWHP